MTTPFHLRLGSLRCGPLFSAFVLAAFVLGAGAWTAPAATAPPVGLTESSWGAVKAEYERRRYAAVEADGERRARNFGQQWLSRFDGRGVLVTPASGSWTWGLELQSFGWTGAARTVSLPEDVSTDAERVSYSWDGGLEEWFVNDGRGLEHGFTVRAAPEGAGSALELNLSVRGGLRPEVSEDGLDARFVDEQGRYALMYAGLKAWDADGKDLSARMEPTAAGLRLRVETAGVRYPVTIDPLAFQTYLKASNTGALDNFGWSVAIQGNTLVVTAPGEDSNATGVNGDQTNNGAINSGAAYVFVRSGAGWVQQAYLKASNTEFNDNFGWSAAISENTIVIGANGEDGNATGVNGDQSNNTVSNAGAAYVFVRTGSVWTQQAYLKAINPGSLHNFGASVSISGNTIVVGASGETSNATGAVDGFSAGQSNTSALNAGAAYTFTRSGGFWAYQSYLKASNTAAGDRFGGSVSISRSTIVVGASAESSNATTVNGDQANNSAGGAGAAYVFVRTPGAWVQQAYLKASNAQALDAFGTAVAISGDRIAVGAPGEDSGSPGVNSNQNDNSASAAGAAYVFDRKGGLWNQRAYLKSSNPDQFDLFGERVAVSQDTVLVGATGEASGTLGINGNHNNGSLNSGAAYLFQHNGSAWTMPYFIKATNSNSGDRFGYAVAVSPREALIGAIGEDSNSDIIDFGQSNNTATDAGAAYVYRGVEASPAVELGVFTQGSWFVDRDGDFNFDPATEVFGWGSPGDTPVRGDWNGDGFQDFGVFSGGVWFIDSNGDAVFNPATDIKGWGVAGWIPVVGDWNGDGVTNLGVVDPATMTWFRDLNGDFIFDPATETSTWGTPGDMPMVGDWNGDGITDLGVLSGATWLIDFNGDGAFDPSTDVRQWGVPGWTPMVGDWNGDGKDNLGMVEPATMTWFRDMNGDFAFDPDNEVLGWGTPGDIPVKGDWNGDGKDNTAAFSNGIWFIDLNGDGAFDPGTEVRAWGVGGWTPLPGVWQ